jgi:hypothetical protein
MLDIRIRGQIMAHFPEAARVRKQDQEVDRSESEIRQTAFYFIEARLDAEVRVS